MLRRGILRPSLPALVLLLGAGAGAALTQDHQKPKKNLEPLVIEREGSTDAGGGILIGADGSRFDYDYLYAYFQIPPKARKHSLVMWHGCLSKAWETRVDGGPGYQRLLVQKGYPVYVIDQPRGRRGARGLGAYSFSAATTGDCGWNTFRYGTWVPPGPRTFFPGVQLSQDPESITRLCRYGGSPGGPPTADRAIPVDAVSALIAKIGPTVLVTHSASGRLGWLTAIKSPNIKAIICYETGSFVFPEGEIPPTPAPHEAIPVSLADFMKLTKIPIQIVFGDNIPTSPSPVPGHEQWRTALVQAQRFVEAINRHGGDASILSLPSIGIHGNTHFAFADLNNEEVADLMSQYLHDKKLDKRENGD